MAHISSFYIFTSVSSLVDRSQMTKIQPDPTLEPKKWEVALTYCTFVFTDHTHNLATSRSKIFMAMTCLCVLTSINMIQNLRRQSATSLLAF